VLQLNIKLLPGDVVQTGNNSEVRIMFANIGVSIIRENTKIKIDELLKTYKSQQIKMNAYKGRILSSLKKLTRKEDRSEIYTPTAVIGVRGTVFLVNVVPEKDIRAAVFAGKVEIRKIDQLQKAVAVEEFKEAILPEADFNRIRIIKMSENTYNEIKGTKGIQEIEDKNFSEIKEEITRSEEKWKLTGICTIG